MSAEPDSTACEAAVPFATCTIVAFRPLSEKKPLRLATYSGSDANDVANWVIETAMGPPPAPEPPPEGGEPPPHAAVAASTAAATTGTAVRQERRVVSMVGSSQALGAMATGMG